jgi:hypothetical protein
MNRLWTRDYAQLAASRCLLFIKIEDRAKSRTIAETREFDGAF